MARFANDEWNDPNSFVAKVTINSRPRLFIFAKKDIAAGSEIRYDYGNKSALWRKKVSIMITSFKQCCFDGSQNES